MTPEEELVYLEGVKSYVNGRIQQLRRKINRSKQPKLAGHKLSYSGLFIQSSCLVPHIEAWIDRGKSIAVLGERANLSDTTIQRIMRGKVQWTREETAEAILIALDLPHVFTLLEKVRIRRKYEIKTEPESRYFEE